MDDKSALLNELKIERGDDADGGSGRWLVVVAVIAVVLGGAGAAAWFTWFSNPAIAVTVVTAEPVSTEVEVGRGSILDASGYVVARRQATVSSKFTGKVVEILIEEGQRVEQDEIVARLDDTNARAAAEQARAQLAQARASLHAAEVALDNAAPIFRRNKDQFEQAIISAQTFDTAKANYDAAAASVEVAAQGVRVAEANLAASERNLEDTVIRAPFAGVVTVKAAQEGEMVSPVSAGGGFTRTGIGTIVDMSSLEVEVDVSENFINRVRANQDVTVRLNAYPDRPIPARVIAIIPTADRAKATVRVRVGLSVIDERVLPQMGVRVSFHDDAAPTEPSRLQPAVLVASEAIQDNGDTGVVFVIRDDVVERRAVQLGQSNGRNRLVLSGLTAGAQLAVGDFSQLVDGARIRIENP